jgi:uncharacterized membrane protein YdfJ with MMPL/SSD domain
MTSLEHSNNLAARMGRWSVGHWKTATIAWIAFVALAFAIGQNLGTKNLDPQKSGSGESGHVQAVLADEWKQSPNETVIVQSKHGSSDDPAFRATVASLVHRLEGLGQVKEVKSPYDRRNEDALISKDGRTVMVPFTLKRTDLKDTKKDIVPIEAAVVSYARAHPAVTLDQVGDVSSEKEIDAAVKGDLEKAGKFSLPVTLGVLLLTFGALVAAGLPVLLGLTAVLGTMGLLALMSHVVAIDSLTGVVVLLIGLAVGVDYSMFYVNRTREERLAGRSKEDAVAAAAATSGRAVLISGLTVIVAMAGMLFTGDKTFTSFAIGTMLVVGVAVLGSLTVLPALLGRLGDKVNRGRIPFLQRRRREDGESRFWNAILTWVLRRPVLAVVLATAFLLALAVPALHMHTAKGGFEMLAPDLKATKAFKKLTEAYPTDSSLVPAQVMVKTDRLGTLPVSKAIAELRRRALASGQFTGPTEVDTNPQRTIALVTLPIAGNGTDARSKAALKKLRGTIIPATVGQIEDADVGVIGGAALNDDFNKQMKRAAPFVFLFVLGLAFLLMLVTFRSIVVAIKAVVLNLLSVAAAYGVLVLVFQHGWGKGLLGFDYTGGIVGFLPIFLFVILFGLSMDYHVFILSRVREAYDRGMSSDDAVAYGIKTTARVVTSAAIVMVGVFSIFAALSFLFLKQFGVGLAIAVLIDATIVRAVLLPATMKLLGDKNWYLPRWLQWLPRLEHDRAVGDPETRPALEPAP